MRNRTSTCAVWFFLQDWLEKTPEEFAQSHNMMLPDGIQPPEANVNDQLEVDEVDSNAVASKSKSRSDSKSPCLFSVNLGKCFVFKDTEGHHHVSRFRSDAFSASVLQQQRMYLRSVGHC